MHKQRLHTSTDDEPTVMLPPPAPVSTLRRPGARRNVAEYREFQDGELIPGTRYRVLQLIGVGGMGSVYEVEHTELGKRFVLKALLRELARREDLVIRLRNEWRALGRLQHPSIVTVTDAGTSASGVPFYVMERLEGETLAQRMRRVRRCPVREAVLMAAGVLEGLAAAHEIGVVHRDVKPPNIFILPDGRPKVLDFGVAKILDDPGVVTARGVAVGTPRYMSPEQARGEPVDGRSDIYSVGLILFEVVAGVSPFDDARDANELILAHLARQAPRLSTLAMEVPAELDGIVLRMLAKPRTARPESANGAARALREIAETLAQRSVPVPRSFDAFAVREPTWVPQGGISETTRPDGVASKEPPTETSVSAIPGQAALDRTTLIQTSTPSEVTSPSLRAVVTSLGVDTLFSGPPTLSAEAPTPSLDGTERTEILTAHDGLDAAATRTSLPSPSRPSVPPTTTPSPASEETKPSARPSGLPRWTVLSASLVLFVFVLAFALWFRAADGSGSSSDVAINPALPERALPVHVGEQLEAADPASSLGTANLKLPGIAANPKGQTAPAPPRPARTDPGGRPHARAALVSQDEQANRPKRAPSVARAEIAPSGAPSALKRSPASDALPGSGL